jgi:O-antigen/teichoic acid export membrane protein
MFEFRRGFRRLMVIVGAVGLLGVLGAYVLGPLAVRLMYDAELSNRTLSVLALGSVFYMVALATAQAVIALSGHAWVALGWTVGVAVFVLATAVSSNDAFRRVELGALAGSGAAMATFLIALRVRLRAGAVVEPELVYEALTDRPLEG